MNTSDENTQPTKIDEYSDRLIDRGLSELIGHETPPNLTGRIFSTATASMPAPVEYTQSKRSKTSRWIAAAVAASLLVTGTSLLLPAVKNVRESARSSTAKSE